MVICQHYTFKNVFDYKAHIVKSWLSTFFWPRASKKLFYTVTQDIHSYTLKKVLEYSALLHALDQCFGIFYSILNSSISF